MNKPIFISICVVLLLTSAVRAEEKKAGILDQLQQFRQTMETGRDPLKETLQNVSQMEEQYQLSAKGVDKDTAQILRNLRNPFIPQLPVPKTADEIPVEQGQVQPDIPFPGPESAAAPEIVKPSFSISGLVWNTNMPQAILNGEVVGIGDVVESWTISDITNEGVEVTFQNKTFKIKPGENKGETRNEY